jgi:hypothetical protein
MGQQYVIYDGIIKSTFGVSRYPPLNSKTATISSLKTAALVYVKPVSVEPGALHDQEVA